MATAPVVNIPEGESIPHRYADGATALPCDTEFSLVDSMDSASNGDLLSLNLELDNLMDPKVGGYKCFQVCNKNLSTVQC